MGKSFRERRSFGPIVTHMPDGTFVPSCAWCVFRVHVSCTYVRPSRDLPGAGDTTPEWCEMRADMLHEAAARRLVEE